MKILLLGRTGQVGEALAETLADLGNVVALDRAHAPFDQPNRLGKVVDGVAPDVVVNAAAYTAVDRAESDVEHVQRVNCDAVAALALAAKRNDAWLVHYSTDYVFDGAKPAPYVETDPTAPLNAYGRSKLAGEEAILVSGCRHLIFRVSWVYAPGHTNFPATMLRLAKDRSNLNVVSDQTGAPTSAGLIARVTAEAIGQVMRSEDPDAFSGLYHLAPKGSASWADIARFVVAGARERGMQLALVPDAVRAIPTSDYPTPAVRPLNSRLDTSKVRRTFGVELPGWEIDMTSWLSSVTAGERG